MNCPACQHAKSIVVDSRSKPASTYRRRECKSCCHRWTSTETAVAEPVLAVTIGMEGEVLRVVDITAQQQEGN